MSIQAIAAVLADTTVKVPGRRMVLIALAWHCDRYGENAFPKHSTLAEQAQMSERMVRKHLTVLEKAGVISRQGFGPKGSVRYALTGLMSGTTVPDAMRNHSSGSNGNGSGTRVPPGTTVPPGTQVPTKGPLTAKRDNGS